MAKKSKKRRAVEQLIDADHLYSVDEAMAKVKEVNTAKFDASVDLHICLGVDPRKSDQNVRGTVTLPHGTGKNKTVLVLCPPEKEEEAKNAGADFVGLDDLVTKIKGGWTDFDVVVAAPTVMAKVGQIGRILGPRGLMPNPKSGTVTMDIGGAVADVKGGKVELKTDKAGIVHSSIGRVSFSAEKLRDNAQEVLDSLNRMKPASTKGIYMKSVTVATTMSPGVKISAKSS